MGMYVSNFKARMDKTAYVQTYTTRPLVDTRIMDIINLNKNWKNREFNWYVIYCN